MLCLAALSLAAAPRPVKFVVPNAAHRGFIKAVYAEAAKSPTALAVLTSLPKPVPLVIGPQKTGGYYDFDTGVAGIGSRHLLEAPVQTVPTLAHEATHAVQKARAVLPSDSFEMEVEAYIVDFKTHRELGIKPPRGTYDDRAQRAFKKGYDEFIAFLKKEYPRNVRYRDYARHLRGQEARVLASRARLRRRLAERAAVLKTLRGSEAANYRAQYLLPVRKQLQENKALLGWVRSDLAIMDDPVRREAYRDEARRIRLRARAEQKKWAR